MTTARAARCWCGRTVATDYPDAIECPEHDHRPWSPPPAPLFPAGGVGEPPPAGSTTSPCRACDGDGFLFHVHDGAVELDGPCPFCTPRQEHAA